jgi:uncharacterized membrane protein SpoIIM required for sporulation
MIGLEPGSSAEKRPSIFKRAGGIVRELYRDEWARWNANYKRYFRIAARALGIGFVLGFVFFMVRPDQERRALAFVLKALKEIPLGAPPLVLALTIFIHNARAAAVAVAGGIVPFACLSVLDPFFNGATLGLLASVSQHQGLNVPLLFLKSVAPHGIIELPAVLYATSVGIHLSVTLGKKVLTALRRRNGNPGQEPVAPPGPDAPGEPGGFLESHPRRAETETGGEIAGGVFQSLFLVVLPLLLVAAAIEAFITPLLR